jgi:hypothetical protein
MWIFGILALNLIAALWVLFDAKKRKMDKPALWCVGTILIMILVVPFYFVKRPLRKGEVPEGGTAWNALRIFATCWTLTFMVGEGTVGITGYQTANGVLSGAELVEAALDMTSGMSAFLVLQLVWFVVLSGALAIGFFLRETDVVEKGPTTGGSAKKQKGTPE